MEAAAPQGNVFNLLGEIYFINKKLTTLRQHTNKFDYSNFSVADSAIEK